MILRHMRAQGARELWINEVLRSSRCLEKLDKVIDDMLAGSIFNLIPGTVQRQSSESSASGP